MAKPKSYHGVAWTIDCDNDLRVVIAVADKHILLHSQEGGSAKAPWRLGYYPNAGEAQQKAVEMTGSYERLRAGKVGTPVPIVLPEREWGSTTQAGTVDERVTAAVMRALEAADFASHLTDE